MSTLARPQREGRTPNQEKWDGTAVTFWLYRLVLLAALAAGAAVVAVAGARAASIPLEALALVAAAVVVAELFHVPSDEESLDPIDAQTFSFSSGIHVGAILVLGPAAAAVVAAFGVLTVDKLRGQRWQHVLFNAAAFACIGGELRGVLRHRRVLVIIAAFAAATIATGLVNATLPRFLGGPQCAALSSRLSSTPPARGAGRARGAGCLAVGGVLALTATRRRSDAASAVPAAA